MMFKRSKLSILVVVIVGMAFLLAAGCGSSKPPEKAAAPAKPKYPEKNVQLIVPVPAGGTTDAMARLMGQLAQKEFGQNFYITNKPGGALTIGAADMVKAAPDGYTLMVTPLGPVVMQPHYRQLPYKYEDFEPVAYSSAVYNVLAVPKGKFKDVKEMVAYMKANPGKLKYGTPAIGGLPHIATENFLLLAGCDAKGVGFNGDADMLAALLGGHIDFAIIGTVNENIKTGALVGLAVGSPARLPNQPNIPTFKELGYDVSTSVWSGIFAPKGTPVAILDRLNEGFNKIFKDPEFLNKAAKIGEIPNPMSRTEFKAFVDKEYAANRKIINESPAGERIKKMMTK